MLRKLKVAASASESVSSLCHFHSYGKAAFCLEELMMTNPHNHLYCEQYAEVSQTWNCFIQQGVGVGWGEGLEA